MGKGTWFLGGLILGGAGIYLFSKIAEAKYNGTKFDLTISNDELKSNSVGATLNLDQWHVPMTQTETGDWTGVWTDAECDNVEGCPAPLSKLSGDYIIKVDMILKDGTTVSKDFPVTLPNMIGMTVPDNIVYQQNAIQLMWR